MVVGNTTKEEKKIAVERFAERMKGLSKYKDVITGTVSDIKEFTLGAGQTKVMELVK